MYYVGSLSYTRVGFLTITGRAFLCTPPRPDERSVKPFQILLAVCHARTRGSDLSIYVCHLVLRRAIMHRVDQFFRKRSFEYDYQDDFESPSQNAEASIGVGSTRKLILWSPYCFSMSLHLTTQFGDVGQDDSVEHFTQKRSR
jgi:hypothetical protein